MSEKLLTQTEPQTSSSATINVQPPLDGDGFIAHYTTFPRNLPATYGNKIYVWDTEGPIVPWTRPPLKDVGVPTDKPSGDMPVEMSIQRRGYIIGYAAAASPNAIIATVYIPASGHDDPAQWDYNSLSIKVPFVGVDSIKVTYTGLTDYDPSANKNWVGIWRGTEVRYTGDPMKSATIVRPETDGSLFLTGLDLKVNSEYSVGYFMQAAPGGRTSLGAVATFKV